MGSTSKLSRFSDATGKTMRRAPLGRIMSYSLLWPGGR